jgi:hypothetical protein
MTRSSVLDSGDCLGAGFVEIVTADAHGGQTQRSNRWNLGQATETELGREQQMTRKAASGGQ